METLIKFEDDGILYNIVEENKQLKYFCIKDGKQYFDLTKEQLNLMYQVIDKVTPSKDLIKTSDYIFNNTKYEIYYDKKTGFRLFFPLPNKEDLIKLNVMFNHMEDYVVDIKIGELSIPSFDKDKFIKRIIKIGKKVINVSLTVLLSQNMTLAGLAFINNVTEYYANEIYYEKAIEETYQLSDEDFLKRIEDAVNKNTNLSEEEKEIFLSLKFTYLDNKEYTDIKYLENTLSKIKIKYNENMLNLYNSKFSAAGTYHPFLNKITFYNCSNLEDVNVGTIGHEAAHSFSNMISVVPSNSFLIETANVVYTNEYMVDFGTHNSYYYVTDYMYAMMELIGSEPIKKFHSFGSNDIIISELCNIIDDKNKAIKLLEMLDDYKTMFEKGGSKVDDFISSKNEIYELMDEYYYQKYNIHIDDDLIMLYYMKPGMFSEKIKMITSKMYPKDNINSDTIDFEIINRRAYFNTELKKDHKDIICTIKVLYEDKLTDVTYEDTYRININDSNRYIKDNNIKVIKENFLFNGYNKMKEMNILTGYDIQTINYTKLLMELIGVDPIKQMNDGKNFNSILSSLNEIINDEEMAINLLNNIDKYCDAYYLWNSLYTSNGPFDIYVSNNKELVELKKTIYNQLNEYYQNKFGVDIENNLMMLYYLDNEKFESKIIDYLKDNYPEDNLKEVYHFFTSNNKTYLGTKTESNEKEINCYMDCYCTDIDGKRILNNYIVNIDNNNISFVKNSFLHNAYNNKSYASYYGEYKQYTDILINLIGEKPILEYINDDNYEVIINSLNDIINDKNKAIKFMDNISKCCINYNYYLANVDSDEILYNDYKDTDEMNNLYQEIRNDLSEYYYAKYGLDMENDLLMLYNLEYSNYDHPNFDRKMFEYAGLDYDDLKTKYDDLWVSAYEEGFFELKGVIDHGDDSCSVDLLAEVEINNENHYVLDNMSKGQSR